MVRNANVLDVIVTELKRYALNLLYAPASQNRRLKLLDVGFGRGTLLEPIPFAVGGEHDQAGWRYRLVEDGPGLALQRHHDRFRIIDL